MPIDRGHCREEHDERHAKHREHENRENRAEDHWVLAHITEAADKPIKFAFANFAFKRRDLHVGDADHDDHVRRRIEDEHPRCADPHIEDCTNCRANDAGDVHADGVQRNRARELLAWNE